MAVERKARLVRILEIGFDRYPLFKELHDRHHKASKIELHLIDRYGVVHSRGYDSISGMKKPIGNWFKWHVYNDPRLSETSGGRIDDKSTAEDKEFTESHLRKPEWHSYFDEVHMHMLSTRPHAHEYLEALSRVLRPGGIICAIEQAPHSVQDLDIDSIKPEADGTFFSRLHYSRPVALDGVLQPRPESDLPEVERRNRVLARRIHDAGFEILRASLNDSKTGSRLPIEVPLGVTPARRASSNISAKDFICSCSDYGYSANQLLILRKRPAAARRK